MSSNPLPPEIKAPPGGIRLRGGRRPLSRRRWRQRDYMARFGQYATARGYDVVVRMEDGGMRAVVIRFPDVDHNTIWSVAKKMGLSYGQVAIARMWAAKNDVPDADFYRIVLMTAVQVREGFSDNERR